MPFDLDVADADFVQELGVLERLDALERRARLLEPDTALRRAALRLVGPDRGRLEQEKKWR